MTAPFDVQGRITYKDDGASAAFNTVTAATTANAAASKAAATAATATGTAMRSAGAGVGQFGSTVGVVAGTLGRLNSGLGQTVGVVGQALGSIQSLATAGLGPVGIAIGVVSAAVTAATALWTAHTAALERDAVAQDAVTAASARYREEQRRIALDIQSSEERMGSSETSLTSVAGRRAATEARRAELQQTDADRNAATLRRIALVSEEAGLGDPNRRRGNGGSAAAARRREEAEDAANFEKVLARQAAERAAEAEEAAAAQQAKLDQIKRDGLVETQRLNAIALEDEEIRVEGVRRAIDRETEAREKAAKVVSDIQSATMGAMGVVTSAIDASLEGSRKSEKEKTKIKAQAALVESIIGAALETAQAVAAYASFNIPQGIAHTIAAGMFVVAAAKAGAAAGGGGASVSAPPSTSGAGAGPMSTGDAGGGKGGNVYNINWGSSALVYAADREQLGNMLVDAIDSSTSRRAA